MKTINCLALVLLFLITGSAAFSQISINIQVKPPYQSRIAEYASRPDLILLTLTNTSQETQHVQLTGSIVGDNGVSLTVKPSYKSPSPIEIAPGQVIALNSTDISFLFNYSSIIVKGIDLNNIVYDARLREGIYQICIRALDYDTRQPISPEEPMGCTMFYINDLEPPIITAPMNEAVLQNTGTVQSFPITWLSSPGAVPSTQYNVKMVEIIADRDPNDAMQSATTPPFFEKTVMGINSVLYGPADPQLTPGRRYALMVQAVDPSGQSIFRNQGKSEVLVFEYGTMNTGVGTLSDESKSDSESRITKENATNTISGKVVWAYKATEETYKMSPRVNAVPEPRAETSVEQSGDFVNYYLGHNELLMKNFYALTMSDPTLMSSSGSNSPATAKSTASIYSPGTGSVDYSYQELASSEGTSRFPLESVTVNLLLRRKTDITNVSVTNNNTSASYDKYKVFGKRTTSTINQMLNTVNMTQVVNISLTGNNTSSKTSTLPAQEDSSNSLLGTATTKQNGEFTLELINPKFEGVLNGDEIVVSIRQDGFDAFEKVLPVSTLDELENIDLGELILLANTYRFNPKIELERPQNTDITNPGIRLRVYREAADEARHPFLEQEGERFNGTTMTRTINGKLYYEIASDSVAKGNNSVQDYVFNFARIFRFGKIYIEAEDLSQNYKKLTTDLQVIEFDTNDRKPELLTVKPSYLLRANNPFVMGEVLLSAGENKIPVGGATVKVSFDREDIAPISIDKLNIYPEYIPPATHLIGNEDYAVSSTSDNTGSVILGAGSNVSFSGIASVLGSNGKSAPVEIGGTSGSAFSYNMISTDYRGSTFPTEFFKYTTITDSTGNFLIGDLPILKEGARYTIELINVPVNYKGMAVLPDIKQTFAVSAGSQSVVQFNISPELVNIVGRVVTEDEEPVGSARLHFKGSSHYFESGQTGIFQTSFYVGKHTLVVEKEGYMPFEKEIIVTGKDDSTSENTIGNIIQSTVNLRPVMNLSNPEIWMNSTQQAPTIQNAISGGQTFSPALFGHTSTGGFQFTGQLDSREPVFEFPGNRGPSADFTMSQPLESAQIGISFSEFSTMFTTTFRGNEFSFASEHTLDLGDVGPLLPRIGKVKFTILEEATSAPVVGASIAVFDTLHVTDQNGQWLYEGFGGPAVVTVKPPSGRSLVSVQKSIVINDNGQVEEVTISLQTGVRVYGSVTGNQQPIPEAQVSVEGFDYLSVTADQSGAYEMFLPSGVQVLKASKTGFFSQREERTLQTGIDTELNFALKDGGGKNISTLLGFEIELDKSEADGQGEKWSGRFVNLKPVTSVFETVAQSIAFNNLKVTFDASGNAIPEGNKVVTDATQIPLKVFGFLPVILKNDSRITVEAAPDGKGSIKGQMQLDVSRVLGSSIKFPVELPIFTKIKSTVASAESSAGTPDQLDIELFRAGVTDGLPGLTLQLATEDNKKASLELYGFTVNLDLTKSSVGTTGIVLSGNIQTPALGPISSANIVIEELSLSDKFSLKTVKINDTGLPELKIASWTAKLTSVLFNENGFKIGGDLKFSIPSSGDSQLNFADLALAKEALFGANSVSLMPGLTS